MTPADGGPVVVVTGASSGIGRLTARAFAARGGAVALVARDEPTLAEAAAECERAGGRALVLPTDVADTDAVEAVADRTVERYGRIDVWVNGAGVIVYGPFLEIPVDIFRGVLETNLVGELNGARAALRVFRRQERGLLVNLCSLWGQVGSPYVSAYVASKFAIRGLSECLRHELVLDGLDDVHVCTVFPGSVDTPIFHHAANYTGREVRPVPPVADPDRVVEAILGCVERPRDEVLVGRGTRALSLTRALAAPLVRRLMPHAFARTALGRRGVETTPGNVLAPAPEENRVRGGWRA